MNVQALYMLEFKTEATEPTPKSHFILKYSSLRGHFLEF
jgi:hypothetical protein